MTSFITFYFLNVINGKAFDDRGPCVGLGDISLSARYCISLLPTLNGIVTTYKNRIAFHSFPFMPFGKTGLKNKAQRAIGNAIVGANFNKTSYYPVGSVVTNGNHRKVRLL